MDTHKPAIALVGAGLIGRSWAVVFARAGHAVAVYDAEKAALRASLELIDATLADLRATGLLDEPPETVRARIRAVDTLEESVREAGYVQENIGEDRERKIEIFAAIDRLAPPHAVLASSTSTIPASQWSEDLPGRARCLVAHPVNPPHVVPLVELSPAPWTAPETVGRAKALLEAAGQVPIVVRMELQGFILNRLQGALLGEAFRLYADGYASLEDIDKAVRDGLGLRWSFMGPFETIDLNAPGGIADYCARYGQPYYEIARQQQPRRWDEALVRRVEQDRRALLPVGDLRVRAAWRDRRLMQLVAHKRRMRDKD
jgi:L-gulonate 3-dehydrogenase